MNLDLAVSPNDPVKAENYQEIYALWKELNGLQHEGRDLSKEDFVVWEKRVSEMLTSTEQKRFQKPLRPHIPISDDTIQYARHFHLVKILWARKGIEDHMKNTGY